MDDERAFEIVLDKLLETSSEHEKMRGERDIARAEMNKLLDTVRQRDTDLRNMREIHDFTTSESFQNLLKEIRGIFTAMPDSERRRDIELRLRDAIEKIDPIPF